MVFNAAKKMPDVYFDEVDVPGSIAGAATAIVGIVGPAMKGPIKTPTLVTNLTRFTEAFGDPITAPRYFGAYAVRGFFENGGQFCYYVRASNAARATATLKDGAGQDTLAVTAKTEGVAGNAIAVTIVASNPARGVTQLHRAGTTLAVASAAGATAITLAGAAGFAPGDELQVDPGGGGAIERATVARIVGNVVHLTAALAGAFAVGNAVRIADILPGVARSIRVQDSAGFEAGSYVLVKDAATQDAGIVDAVDGTNHILSLRAPLANGYSLDPANPAAAAVTSLEFDLQVQSPAGAASHKHLSLDPRHSQYFASVDALKTDPHVELALVPTNTTPPPSNLPAPSANVALAGGQADVPATLQVQDYKDAIDALKRVPDVTLVCAPDRVDDAVQLHLIQHCEEMQDRFAILDPAENASTDAIKAQRAKLASDRGYAALYYPRVYIAEGSDQILVPPSGHLAGAFARTDDSQGVHKAPANEQLKSVLGLERTLTEPECGDLNDESVNVLRTIRNRGCRIWGARTLAAGTQWRYVNVRRLVLYIEESIRGAMGLYVFAPNNQALWKSIKRQVDAFLMEVWKDGALYGTAPEEGFNVRIDAELNPATQIALGILTVEVRLRPTPPAEFIVFRIVQSTSTSLTEEV